MRSAAVSPPRRGEPPGSAGGSPRASPGCSSSVPALAFLAMFVLQPLVLSLQYSFYDWNGTGVATWSGSTTTERVSGRRAANSIFNAFKLIIFFSFIPVTLGLVTASFIRGPCRVDWARCPAPSCSSPDHSARRSRDHVELGAGQVRDGEPAPGGDRPRRDHAGLLGDFDWALVAVGFIGVWVLLGLTTLLLLAGVSKIDPALYEAARIDGASAFQEFRSITVPGVRTSSPSADGDHHPRAVSVRRDLHLDERRPRLRDASSRD